MNSTLTLVYIWLCFIAQVLDNNNQGLFGSNAASYNCYVSALFTLNLAIIF